MTEVVELPTQSLLNRCRLNVCVCVCVCVCDTRVAVSGDCFCGCHAPRFVAEVCEKCIRVADQAALGLESTRKRSGWYRYKKAAWLEIDYMKDN